MKEIELEELRALVESIDKGIKKIRESGITHKALVCLIQKASCGYKQGHQTKKPCAAEINAAINGMENLKTFVFGADERSN